MKYRWIQNHRNQFTIDLMCKVIKVSASGFYDSISRADSQKTQHRQKIKNAATAAYKASNGIYGYRKVHQDLLDQGLKCNRKTVANTMSENSLFSKIKRKRKVVTTNSNHKHPIADNQLCRDFDADKPNRKWVADITYVDTDQGWLYLATVLDLYSRKVVGWSMADHLRADLVCDALEMAISNRHPSKGLMHHSDRGVQYASDQFQAVLSAHGIECSMSSKGDCYDNAAMESFFGSLKSEWVYHEHYKSRSEAKQSLFRYIEIFYNRNRRHASLGYVSPDFYEQKNVA